MNILCSVHPSLLIRWQYKQRWICRTHDIHFYHEGISILITNAWIFSALFVLIKYNIHQNVSEHHAYYFIDEPLCLFIYMTVCRQHRYIRLYAFFAVPAISQGFDSQFVSCNLSLCFGCQETINGRGVSWKAIPHYVLKCWQIFLARWWQEARFVHLRNLRKSRGPDIYSVVK